MTIFNRKENSLITRISEPVQNHQVRAYLQLMRPANIVTAWADILTGFAASGVVAIFSSGGYEQVMPASLAYLAWLLVATSGLYGGGVVFNDVFDAELDRQERPERPIPSGRASRRGAALLGSVLLAIALLAAAQVSLLSLYLAVVIATAALFYDAMGKHHPVVGPLNMGYCRGANLLLGMSVIPPLLAEHWFLALIPITYIAAVTAISRGEVQGGESGTGAFALLLLVCLLDGLLALELLPNYSVLVTLPFLALFVARVFPPFIRAVRNPSPEVIQQAVRVGVLSLILLDATVAAGFAGWVYGLLVLSLLPISMTLARWFAVT